MREAPPQPDLQRALAAWPGLARARVTPLAGGLVHRSWAVTSEASKAGDADYVLQCVSSVFSPRIHENIEAVTQHLLAAGLPSLRIVRTGRGELYADLGPGGSWRLVTRLPGRSFDVCASPELARSAGELVARFHCTLNDFARPLHPLGFPFHDTPAHLAALAAALRSRPGHPLHREVAAVARRIEALAADWRDLSELPRRVIHGDLKFNNLLFTDESLSGEEGLSTEATSGAAAGTWRAFALIDFDTLSRLPLWVELGDAWRSWCNRCGEDSPEAELDLGLFRAAAEGYFARATAGTGEPLVSRAELASLAEGIERVALELAARFAADALEESYFGWDPARFATAGEHNLLRARGQLSLAEQARAARAEQLGFLFSLLGLRGQHD